MRIVFDTCRWRSHKPNGCSHGPQVWPWWKLFGFLICKIDIKRPSSGWRLWIYLRKWKAHHFDFIIDRRGTYGKK